MPIEWLPDALDRLTGDLEPYEVSQVLKPGAGHPAWGAIADDLGGELAPDGQWWSCCGCGTAAVMPGSWPHGR